MTKLLRRALLALALIAGITPAVAQTFPTVPGQSLIGRLGQPGDTGPSQALLFSTVRSALHVPTIPAVYAVDSGVKCDGVTDDAPAIQRAINTADLLGGVQIIMPAGRCVEKSTPFLNKWNTAGLLTVPGLSLVGQGKGVTTLDNQTGGFAIAVNPEWKAAHQAQALATASITGGSLPSGNYYLQLTMNDDKGAEVYVTSSRLLNIASGSTGSISVAFPVVNTGYSFNVHLSATTTPDHYALINGGNASAVAGNQTGIITAQGSARTVPVTKIATWQQANISDLAITSTTNTTGASGISYFKAGYANLTNVYLHHLNGTGFELTDFSGDVDGSFNVAVHNSRFDAIVGWCVDASGLALELSNFTVDDRSIFNICGNTVANLKTNFTITAITNSATATLTTSAPHTLQSNDEIYIQNVAGMSLTTGFYRAAVLSGTTFQLKDLNGNFVDTTALGAYTASSGTEYLAWRPPSPTNGVTGCLRWMGLIGTFRNLDFTQCNNVAMYFTELGSSDNATIENVDMENTAGKGLYIAALLGGSLRNSECLTATASGATISCVQLGTGAASGGVQNFRIENVKVRSDVSPAVGFEQFQNTNNTGSFADTNRATGITWQAPYDAAGQSRFNGFTFDAIPGQALFKISGTNTAQLIPIGIGAGMPLHLKATGEWVTYKVPTAGLSLATGALTASTQYYFYLFNSAISQAPYVGALEVSSAAPVLDAAGYLVKSGDSTRTYIGTAITNGSGNFVTTGVSSSRYPVQAQAPITLDTNGIVGCPSCVLISGTAHGDSNYSILSTDRYVYTSAAFTAPRTWTLPAANSLAVGTTIWVQDAQNTVGSTNTLTVQRAGADLINNFSSTLVITGPSGGITFTTDGVSNWGVPVQTVSTGGTGRQTLTNHGVLVGATANPITQLAVGTNGQLLAGATGADPAFVTASQDCTLSAAGAFTCTKTNNVSYAASATTDTTNATNISSGTLAVARGGVDQTAWTNYAPSLTTTGGNFTTATSNGFWKQYGKTACVRVTISVTTLGPASGSMIVGLPVTAAGTFGGFIPGQEISTKKNLGGQYGTSATTASFTVYDGTSVVALGAGTQFFIEGCFEAA